MNIPDFEVIGMKGNGHLPEIMPAKKGTQPPHLKAMDIPALLLHQCQWRLQNEGSALPREKVG